MRRREELRDKEDHLRNGNFVPLSSFPSTSPSCYELESDGSIMYASFISWSTPDWSMMNSPEDAGARFSFASIIALLIAFKLLSPCSSFLTIPYPFHCAVNSAERLLVDTKALFEFSPSGILFVCSQDVIVRVDLNRRELEQYAGGGNLDGYLGCTRTEVAFGRVCSFAFGGEDSTLFVYESSAGYIYRIVDDIISGIFGIPGRDNPHEGEEQRFGKLHFMGDTLYLVTLNAVFALHKGVMSKIYSYSSRNPLCTSLAIPSLNCLLSGKYDFLRNQTGYMQFEPMNNEPTSRWRGFEPTTREDCQSLVLVSELLPDSPTLVALSSTGILRTIDPNQKDRTRADEFRSHHNLCPLQELSHKFPRSDMIYHMATNCLVWTDTNSGVHFSREVFDVPNHLDLSLLISEECQRADFVHSTASFIHEQSGTLFNLHQSILDAHRLTQANLVKWGLSTASEETIRGVLMTMYGMRMESERGEGDADPKAKHHRALSAELSASSSAILSDLCGRIHLLHDIGISARFWEIELNTRLLKFSPDELFDLLLLIWNDYDEDDLMTQMVVSALRPSRDIFLERASELFKFAPSNPSHYVRLLRMHIDTTPLYSPVTGSQAQVPERSVIANCIAQDYKLCWIPQFPPASLKTRPPGSYYFQIDEMKGYIESYDWILFPQWPYFRRLVSSGMSEYCTRIVTLPSDFPLALLLGILSCCHAVFAPSLTEGETIYLLQNAQEFCLVDDALTPLQPFQCLIDRATSRFLSNLPSHPFNFTQLQQLSKLPFQSPILDLAAARYLAKHWTELTRIAPAELCTLPKRWLPKTLEILIGHGSDSL